MKLQPLPLSVRYKAGESATSLAARLARRNGSPRLITFCSDVGVDYFRLANGDPDEVRALAMLSGAPAASLLHNTPYCYKQNWFRLGQEDIKFTAFQRTKPRVCPICNQAVSDADPTKSAYQTGHAQLSSVRACLEHQCILVDLPPAPSNKDHFDITQMAAGFRLPSAKPVSGHDLSFETYIRRRLQGAKGDSWFDRLPFHVATQTAEHFGLMLTKGADFKPHLATPLDWLAAGHVGYGFLQHGPEALIAKLAELEEKRPDDNSMYRARFGLFFNWLRYRDDDPDFDIVRDLVRDFIFATYPVPKGMQVLGQQNPHRRLHTHTTLAKEKRLNTAQVAHALVRRGFVRRNEQNCFVTHNYVPENVASEVAHELRRVWNSKRTAQKLGVSRSVLDELNSHGLIHRHFRHKGAVPAYHSDEIWRFARSVTSAWQPYFRTPNVDSWVPFNVAAKRCKCSTWQVIAMVVHRKLPVTNPKKGHTLLSDHLTCPKRLLVEFSLLEQQAVSIIEAKKHLRCDAEKIEQLLNSGEIVELPAYAKRSAIRHRMFLKDSDVFD